MFSHYTQEELLTMGFKSIGEDCLISRKASFYDCKSISIGNNVRIDDFCIISGKIVLGNHIHIAAYVALYGAQGIILEDYTGISARSTVYSAMDDFGGDYLIGPIHSREATHVTGGEVIVKRYSQIGAHVLVFPNLTIGEGVVVGAYSMVRKNLDPWGIYYGIPVKRQKERSKGLLKYID